MQSKKRHPSFFGLHFSLALVPDRDPLRHIALPLDRYRNRDRYRVSFHFDYDCDPDFDFDGASQKSINYFRGTMKDALIFYISCTQGVALGWYILPFQGADDGLHW